MTLRVRDLGEFALIDRLLAVLPPAVRGSDSVFGAGDDCAYWQSPAGTTVVTSDALVEGVHFRLDWTDWRSLGHKMIAVNLSDLASMGCTPKVVIVTLALTGDEDVSDLEALYRGAGELAEIYGVVIAGGDIVRTGGTIMFSVTALGEQPYGQAPMLRSAAVAGETVLVSGTLGASAAGLHLLQQPMPLAATADLLITAHIRPAPRVALGQLLIACGVRCCMDLSDGLAGDLPKILQASNVGAIIHANAIPVVPAVRALFPDSWLNLAVHGGEDYELLFTAAPGMVSDLVAAATQVGATLTPIGEITAAAGLRFLDANDEEIDVCAAAWDHFAGN